MPDWLRPWLEPTAFAASAGALLAGVGLLVTRLSSAVVAVLPELRVTVDWWDERRARRSTLVDRPPPSPRPRPAQLDTSRAPRQSRQMERRAGDSTQLALPLEDEASTSSPPVRRVS